MNFIFYVALTIGLIWLFIMLLGGGFPFTLSNNEASVRFDVSRMGWNLLDLSNGVMTIAHDKKAVKEGWGCLQFDYKYSSKKSPGVYSECYGFESFLQYYIWLRSRNECTIGLTLKDKKGEYDFTMPVRVGNKWVKVSLTPRDYQERVGHKGRLDYNRFAGYIAVRDITSRPTYSTNTIWVDTMYLMK